MARKVIKKKASSDIEEILISKSMVFKYLSENIKTVVSASAVICVLLISYIAWGTYSRQKNQKAGEAFYSAMKVYQAKVDALGTSPDTFKTSDDKFRAVADKFAELSKRYKRSNIGSISLLYAANAHYNLKEFDKAIELYSKLLFNIDREDPSLHGNSNEIKVSPGIIRDTALYGLAYSYEQKGDLKKAVEMQASLTSSKDSHLIEMGLIALGRLYEKSNDKAKALETYQKVISDFPESSNLSSVKEKVERLKG